MSAEIEPPHNEERIRKACPVVLRKTPDGLQFLAFSHPEAGNQIVKGTIEDGESAAQAAMRELKKASDVSPQGHPHDLGKSDGVVRGESWHFMVCRTSPLAHEWNFETAGDNSQTLSFFWQSFDSFLEDGWEASIIRAIRYIELKLEAMSSDKLEALVPTANSEIANKILELLANEKSIDPTAIARTIAGKDEKEWRRLMKPIRTEAVRLTKQRQVTILRKGKVVDPDDFKGVYRIGRME